MKRQDPFKRPLDRALVTVRIEFGHNCAVPVWQEGPFAAPAMSARVRCTQLPT